MFSAIQDGLSSLFAVKKPSFTDKGHEPSNIVQSDLQELIIAVQNSETISARQNFLEQIFNKLAEIDPQKILESNVPSAFPEKVFAHDPAKFVKYSYKIFLTEDTALVINCRIPTQAKELEDKFSGKKYDLYLSSEEASYSFSILKQFTNRNDDLKQSGFFEKRNLIRQGQVFNQEFEIASDNLPDGELFNLIKNKKNEQYQSSLASFMDVVEKVLKEPITTLCLGEKVLDWKIDEQHEIRTYSIDYQGIRVQLSAKLDSHNPEQLSGTAVLCNPKISFKQLQDYTGFANYSENVGKINHRFLHSWDPSLRINNPIQARLVELSSRATMPMLGAIEAGRENYRREYVGIADQEMENILRSSDKKLKSLTWKNEELQCPQLLQFTSIYKCKAITFTPNRLRFEMDYESGMNASNEVSVNLFIGNVLLNKQTTKFPRLTSDYKHGDDPVLDFCNRLFNLDLNKINSQSFFRLGSQKVLL